MKPHCNFDVDQIAKHQGFLFSRPSIGRFGHIDRGIQAGRFVSSVEKASSDERVFSSQRTSADEQASYIAEGMEPGEFALEIYSYPWLFLVVAPIPGTGDDGLVNVIALIDALLIFGAARRCLHDYIAGSKFV